MTFVKGHHPAHDVAAAGRKGKAASPWSRERPMPPELSRLHKIRRSQERLRQQRKCSGEE